MMGSVTRSSIRECKSFQLTGIFEPEFVFIQYIIAKGQIRTILLTVRWTGSLALRFFTSVEWTKGVLDVKILVNIRQCRQRQRPARIGLRRNGDSACREVSQRWNSSSFPSCLLISLSRERKMVVFQLHPIHCTRHRSEGIPRSLFSPCFHFALHRGPALSPPPFPLTLLSLLLPRWPGTAYRL